MALDSLQLQWLAFVVWFPVILNIHTLHTFDVSGDCDTV